MADFKIAAAQVASVRGDIDANIRTHTAAILAAAEHQVTVLVFPELSLTGYERDLAAELAITEHDSRLTPFAELARQHRMEIAIGAPLHNNGAKPAIGAVLFSADGSVSTYRKMHLGTSEQPFFEPGDTPVAINTGGQSIGVAICADTSRPSHAQAYADLGANIYAAGVFLNEEWYATDSSRLAVYAARHRMLTVMANHAASVGSFTSVGKSAIWAPDGTLLVQAEGNERALLIATLHDASWRGDSVALCSIWSL